MKDMGLKKKVLSEIMDLMNEKDGEMLGKHPKLMAAKIEIEPKEGEEKEMGLEKDQSEELPLEESLESEKEDSLVDGLTPEMIEKLKEMLGE